MSLSSHPFSPLFPRIFVGITKKINYYLPNQLPGLTGKEPTQQVLIASRSNHPNILLIFSFLSECHDSSDHQVKSPGSASQQPGRAQRAWRMAPKASHFKKLL